MAVAGTSTAKRMALAAVLACLAGLALPVAQQGTFRSGVDVVIVDVTVVDRTGRPVDDLTAADFRVTVDRRPREIASVQFITHAIRRLPRVKAADPAPPASRAARRQAGAGRDILIAVDEDSMDAGTGLMARKAIEKFVDRLAPADRVGIATIPRLRTSIALTTNRSDVQKALSRVIAGGANDGPAAYWIGVSEALDIERDDEIAVKKVVDRECRGSYPERIDMHCVKDVLAEAHQLALQTRLRGQRSVDALQQLADGLRQIDGPKTVVLVSGGLPMPESGASFSRLAAAFARGQIVLYTIYIERIPGGRPGLRQSPTSADDDRVESDGVETVTSSTGGSLLRAIGTTDAYFDRVAMELSGSYLLGIEVSAADRDGHPHSVNVSTSRQGVEVRARRQYIIPRESRAEAGGVIAGPVTDSPRAVDERRAATKVREVEVTPPEVEALVARATGYVAAYETQFSGFVAEERYHQVLSKWKTRAGMLGRELVARGEWARDSQRALRSDYLLVKAPEVAGWLPFRDVFEVDGQKVRERDERLQKLFLEAPNSAWDRANEILNESARYNIGYTRNTNLPTLALMFLHPSNRDRFVFRKAGEQVVEDTPAWQIDFREHATPTLVRNGERDLPAEGSFWIDPTQGRVLRTSLRLNAEQGSVEIVVVYRRNERLGEIWVPVEMRETSTAGEVKLECLAQYTNFRRFQVTTAVEIPKR